MFSDVPERADDCVALARLLLRNGLDPDRTWNLMGLATTSVGVLPASLRKPLYHDLKAVPRPSRDALFASFAWKKVDHMSTIAEYMSLSPDAQCCCDHWLASAQKKGRGRRRRRRRRRRTRDKETGKGESGKPGGAEQTGFWSQTRGWSVQFQQVYCLRCCNFSLWGRFLINVLMHFCFFKKEQEIECIPSCLYF